MPVIGKLLRSVLNWCRSFTRTPAEPQYRVGDYIADYSELTPEEIQAVDPHVEELFRNSTPVVSDGARKS
jgi:hypothetical protein